MLNQTRKRPARPVGSSEPEIAVAAAPERGAGAAPAVERDEFSRDQKHWKGRQIDQFRLQRLIGSGAMSIVIQAEDQNLKRTVALKFLRKNVPELSRAEQVEQFMREATCAASLEHPNIVRIYGFQQHGERWYLIMEHMEGGSLLQLVERAGPLSPRRACMFLADAASGIAEAHAAGIIHRDIKPSNLLLTRTARCKVSDFGLVRPQIVDDDFRIANTPAGSRHFLAPEALRHEPATPAVDVYALAATLYTVIAGRPPFPSDDRRELNQLILQAPPPNLRELVPHAPLAVAELIQQCMNKNPRLRPSASEFAGVLRAELSDMPDIGSSAGSGFASNVSVSEVSPSAPNVPAQTAVPPKNQWGKAWLVGAAAAVVVMIVGLVVVLRPAGSADNRAAAASSAVGPAVDSSRNSQQAVEVSSLKARTDLLFERIAKLDGGQGFDTRIEQAASMRGEAVALTEARKFDAAVEKLRALLETCQSTSSLDQQRTRAALRNRETTAAQEAARAAGAGSEAGSPMAAGLDLCQSAARKFADGGFDAAGEDWIKARAQFDAATLLARDRAAEQAASTARNRVAQIDAQVRDYHRRAMELLPRARRGETSAASDAAALLEKALSLRPGDGECLKLKSQLQALLARKPGERMENSIGMVLSYCPAGTFSMGSPAGEKGRDEDENQVRVTLTRSFYMSRTAVTQSQWRTVMGENYKSPDGAGDDVAFIGPDMPVHNVSWNDAVAFCNRLGGMENRRYRLPTEAEWEYACRAGGTQAFAFGDDLSPAQAQVDGSEPYRGKTRGPTPKRPQRVASFPPNAWSLYDMHGNVAQWCADWYAPYPVGDATDPRGPAQPASLESANRVVRGGSWCHPARTARCASRWNYSPVVKTNYIGFRVVLEMEPAGDAPAGR